jgi:hypothetical protein
VLKCFDRAVADIQCVQIGNNESKADKGGSLRSIYRDLADNDAFKFDACVSE